MSINRHGPLADSWWGSTLPPTFVSLAAASWVGNEVQFTVPGRVAGLRFVPETAAATGQMGIMWNISTLQLTFVCGFKFATDAPAGWNQTWFRPWFRIATAATYRFAVMIANGGYFRFNSRLSSPRTQNAITFNHGFQSTSNLPPFATITTNANANGVDVLFYPD